jgi:hypothetical protein
MAKSCEELPDARAFAPCTLDSLGGPPYIPFLALVVGRKDVRRLQALEGELTASGSISIVSLCLQPSGATV